jgi:hypothetical protein
VWPGDERATIDHVVIGPSGAWVIIERAVGARSSLTRVAAQAQAVSTALGGVHVGAILAVFDGDVPDGAIVHDGVTIAIADVPTMDVIVDAPTRMGRIEIARYAELATNRLRPLAVTDACLAGTPDSIPTWQPKATSAVAPTKPRHRWWWLAIPVLAALAVAGAYRVRPTETTEPAASPVAVAFECRDAGAGWTAVITWPDLEDVHAVLLSPTLDGPWTAVPSPVRDGIEPGQHSLVRVQYGTGMEATTEVTAPDTSC